jgi:hypothetical protein
LCFLRSLKSHRTSTSPLRELATRRSTKMTALQQGDTGLHEPESRKHFLWRWAAVFCLSSALPLGAVNLIGSPSGRDPWLRSQPEVWGHGWPIPFCWRQGRHYGDPIQRFGPPTRSWELHRGGVMWRCAYWYDATVWVVLLMVCAKGCASLRYVQTGRYQVSLRELAVTGTWACLFLRFQNAEWARLLTLPILVVATLGFLEYARVVNKCGWCPGGLFHRRLDWGRNRDRYI